MVGLGNPDRGDDGIGAIVASRLAGRLPSDVAIVVRSGDMMSLIEDWARFRCAGMRGRRRADGGAWSHSPDRSGDWRTCHTSISTTSSHGFGIADAVGLARALQLAPRDIIVYAVEGCCFNGGAPMTAEVAAAAGEVADCIVAEVSRLRQSLAEAASHA